MENARECAFNALNACLTGGGFLQEYLAGAPPFSVELACGVMRQKKALEEQRKKLGFTARYQRKEKIILWMALYEKYYMQPAPMYALVNEMVTLAKTKCHHAFAKFCNAKLRTLPEKAPCVSLSYPDYLLTRIDEKYLHLMNKPPKHFARQRYQDSYIRIQNPKNYADNPLFYIQNPTPWELILTAAGDPPKTILDLCAAPGGKTLALHDLFPNAKITSNDVSAKRLKLLEENMAKYNIPCKTTVCDGRTFAGTTYDLIVIDAPCSNSGVLGKRPESRWRASSEQITQLNLLQKELLQNATTLLNPDGEIWYITCSILPEENENLVSALPLTVKTMRTIYPDAEGMDGGFIAQLTKTVR